jgi:hypothetical protein
MAEFSVKFRIKWDGRYVAGVSKISGLRRSTEVTQHREGGEPSSSRKSPRPDRILAHRAEVRLNLDISIRKAELSDAEAIWKCYTAPQAVRNTLQLPYRSLESVRDLLNKSGEGDHILVAIIDGEVVGVIGLHTSLRPRVNHRAEIG